MKKAIFFSLVILLLLSSGAATTLTGTIYNQDLEPARDVLLEVDSQRLLSADGTYSLELPPGTYPITIQKDNLVVVEEVEVKGAELIYDLFLIPGFEDEDDLWQDTEEELFEDGGESFFRWQYLVAALIVIVLLWRFWKARRRFGPLGKFRKKVKEEAGKTAEQHRAELAAEPGYLDKTIKTIKEHDGRLTQKELRREMLYLSEAKISLILTELEHKGMIERVKKGRGKVVILKELS